VPALRGQAVTLTEFLLARIAEDEEAADQSVQLPSGLLHIGSPDTPLILVWSPARVLAECEAKRRIVEWHEKWPVLVQTEPKMETDPTDIRGYTMRMTQQIQWQTEREYFRRFGEAPPSGPILRLLAAVYADHPDYREEWKP
jgi:hypothetical protein